MPCTRSTPSTTSPSRGSGARTWTGTGFEKSAARCIGKHRSRRRPADRQTGAMCDGPVQDVPEAGLSGRVEVHRNRHSRPTVRIDLEVGPHGRGAGNVAPVQRALETPSRTRRAQLDDGRCDLFALVRRECRLHYRGNVDVALAWNVAVQGHRADEVHPHDLAPEQASKNCCHLVAERGNFGRGHADILARRDEPYNQAWTGLPSSRVTAVSNGSSVFASWLRRVLAALVDGALQLVSGVPLIIGLVIWRHDAIAGRTTSQDALGQTVTSNGDPSGVALALSLLGVLPYLGFWIWNRWWRQGTTGRSMGKSLLGLRLVDANTMRPPGELPRVRTRARSLDRQPGALPRLALAALGRPATDPGRQAVLHRCGRRSLTTGGLSGYLSAGGAVLQGSIGSRHVTRPTGGE